MAIKRTFYTFDYQVETRTGTALLQCIYDYEEATDGDDLTPGTDTSIDLFKIIYKGRNIMRLLAITSIEAIIESIKQDVDDAGFERSYLEDASF